MRVRYTLYARQDIARIATDLAAYDSSYAKRVVGRIEDTITLLGQFPYYGRQSDVPGTREAVVRGLPYKIVYTVMPEVAILRVKDTRMEDT